MIGEGHKDSLRKCSDFSQPSRIHHSQPTNPQGGRQRPVLTRLSHKLLLSTFQNWIDQTPRTSSSLCRKPTHLPAHLLAVTIQPEIAMSLLTLPSHYVLWGSLVHSRSNTVFSARNLASGWQHSFLIRRRFNRVFTSSTSYRSLMYLFLQVTIKSSQTVFLRSQRLLRILFHENAEVPYSLDHAQSFCCRHLSLKRALSLKIIATSLLTSHWLKRVQANIGS